LSRRRKCGSTGSRFRPDGDFVFYSAYPGSGGVASLFRIPVLGGQPTRILEDIDSPVAFSPDAKQFAFIRGDMRRGVNEVMIASVDGSGARQAGAPKPPDVLMPEAVSWSRDGRTILATANSTRPIPSSVIAIDVATGETHSVGEPWAICPGRALASGRADPSWCRRSTRVAWGSRSCGSCRIRRASARVSPTT
jgi:Tol biopolymer transport system component